MLSMGLSLVGTIVCSREALTGSVPISDSHPRSGVHTRLVVVLERSASRMFIFIQRRGQSYLSYYGILSYISHITRFPSLGLCLCLSQTRHSFRASSAIPHPNPL